MAQLGSAGGGANSKAAAAADTASTAGSGYYQHLTQKTKLILPTAMWALLILAGLCFLCLLSSLNRTLNSLDTVLERQDTAERRAHSFDLSSPPQPLAGKLAGLLDEDDSALLADKMFKPTAAADAPSAAAKAAGESPFAAFDKSIKDLLDSLPASNEPSIFGPAAAKPLISGSITIETSGKLTPPASRASFGRTPAVGFGPVSPFGDLFDKLLPHQQKPEDSLLADILGFAKPAHAPKDFDFVQADGEFPPASGKHQASGALINANIGKISVHIGDGDHKPSPPPHRFPRLEDPLDALAHALNGPPGDANEISLTFSNEIPKLPPHASLFPSMISASFSPAMQASAGASKQQRPGAGKHASPPLVVGEDFVAWPLDELFGSSAGKSKLAASSKSRPQGPLKDTPMIMFISDDDFDKTGKTLAGHQAAAKKPSDDRFAYSDSAPLSTPFGHSKIGPLSPYELADSIFDSASADAASGSKQPKQRADRKGASPKDASHKDAKKAQGDEVLSSLFDDLKTLFPFEQMPESRGSSPASTGSKHGGSKSPFEPIVEYTFTSSGKPSNPKQSTKTPTGTPAPQTTPKPASTSAQFSVDIEPVKLISSSQTSDKSKDESNLAHTSAPTPANSSSTKLDEAPSNIWEKISGVVSQALTSVNEGISKTFSKSNSSTTARPPSSPAPATTISASRTTTNALTTIKPEASTAPHTPAQPTTTSPTTRAASTTRGPATLAPKAVARLAPTKAPTVLPTSTGSPDTRAPMTTSAASTTRGSSTTGIPSTTSAATTEAPSSAATIATAALDKSKSLINKANDFLEQNIFKFKRLLNR